MGCAEVKNWADASKITDMVKTCTRYSRDLIGESELRIKDKTKVASGSCRQNRDATAESKYWIANFVTIETSHDAMQ